MAVGIFTFAVCFFVRLRRGILWTSANTDRCWVSLLSSHRPTVTQYKLMKRTCRTLLPRRRPTRMILKQRETTGSAPGTAAAPWWLLSSSQFYWLSSPLLHCRCGSFRLELVSTFCFQLNYFQLNLTQVVCTKSDQIIAYYKSSSKVQIGEILSNEIVTYCES